MLILCLGFAKKNLEDYQMQKNRSNMKDLWAQECVLSTGITSEWPFHSKILSGLITSCVQTLFYSNSLIYDWRRVVTVVKHLGATSHIYWKSPKGLPEHADLPSAQPWAKIMSLILVWKHAQLRSVLGISPSIAVLDVLDNKIPVLMTQSAWNVIRSLCSIRTVQLVEGKGPHW